MPLAAGTRLGPYEIVAPLGAGGMGEVYRARDSRLDRTVAIKVLPQATQADPQYRARFDREARAVAALSHSHICTLHDVGEEGGIAYLVMELLEGETLSTRLTRGALPLTDAVRTAVEVASGLDAAHRAGIVHRDLKPGNIMLTRSGAKLLDFGLARTGNPAGAKAAFSQLPTTPGPLTAEGTILGTFQYMAPEQLEGREADARTDVFAFGAVVYEMLTGKRPFEGATQASTIGAILHAAPAPVSTWQPSVSPALDRVIATCLAKDPDERWQSVGDLKRELQWSAEAGASSFAPDTLGPPRRTRGALAWGLAIVASVLAAVAWILYLRQARATDAIVRFQIPAPPGAVRATQAAFAVAPDGRSLAFVARSADGMPRVFIRQLDARDSLPLAGSDRAQQPFWAPDGRSLGFAREGGLYRVGLDGSAPRRLCDVPGNTFGGGTWSPHGVIVFASAGGLLRVADTGGPVTPVTTPDPNAASHTGPWFLPDGRHLLYLEHAARQTRGTIWVTSVDDPVRVRIGESHGAAAFAGGWLFSTTGPPRVLMAQPFDPSSVTLRGTAQPINDALTIANTSGQPSFSVSASGVLVVDRPPQVLSQLAWVDRKGQTVGTVGPSAAINVFALAPDQRRVVAQVTDRTSLKRDLWLFDVGRDAGTRLTFDGANKLKPLWAGDGRHVHYTQRASSGLELRTLALGATESTAFENPGAFVQFLDATRDGRYLVFKSSPKDAGIWIQRVGDPAERRSLVQGPFDAWQARVSPDGRWLAYALALPGGPEIFVQPFDRTGDRVQVSASGGSGPVWRDDGRELFYEGPEGVMAVAVSDGTGAFQAGSPQKLFAIRTQGLVSTQPHNFEVASRGQRFLVNTVVGDSDNVPLEVTLNWTTGLKK